MEIQFIAGVPTCGKTSVGNLLRDENGFLHLDLEDLENGTYLHKLYYDGRFDDFVSELRKLHPRVVCTCGIPVPNLPRIISPLHKLNVVCWWLNGDVERAESQWKRREGRDPVGPERAQFDALAAVGSDYASQFGDRCIEVLNADGYATSIQEVAQRILESGDA